MYLVDSEENATTQLQINVTQATRGITVDGLRENSCYHYQVEASNQFGSSRPSTPVEIGNLITILTLSFPYGLGVAYPQGTPTFTNLKLASYVFQI